MQKTFMEAISNRRSCYALSDYKSCSEEQIVRLMDVALREVPSAYNAQSTRLVALFGPHHRKLWQFVCDALLPIVPEQAFAGVKRGIEQRFAAGYGTILFYEDQRIIDQLKSDYPTYAWQMERYADHTSAMHQFTLWTFLAEQGLGASLQHYNPLIDDRIIAEWEIDPAWRLVAQMPFGSIDRLPDHHPQQSPVTERRRVFW